MLVTFDLNATLSLHLSLSMSFVLPGYGPNMAAEWGEEDRVLGENATNSTYEIYRIHAAITFKATQVMSAIMEVCRGRRVRPSCSVRIGHSGLARGWVGVRKGSLWIVYLFTQPLL